VSFDTQEENAAFAKKFDFNFALLCDTSRSMGLAYGATTEGSSEGAKRIGVIIDPEGKVLHFEPKASSKTYPEDALNRI